jgi:hypothetical protein
MPNEAPVAIYGDAVAGQSQEDAQVRSQLESLIHTIDKHTFDVAELLYTVQTKGLYQPEFSTYKEYTRSLKLKDRKAEYLPKIVKVMRAVNIERSVYEPLGIGRLREITSLDPGATWENPETGEETPMSEFIIGFVEKGEEITFEDLQKHVRTLKGFVGENDVTWLNVCLKRSVMDNTVRPALELAKNHIGSVGKDDDGVSKDASDGAALEVLAVDYLNDPANNVLPEDD